MEKFNNYGEYLNFTLSAPDEQFWDKSFLANTKQAYEIYLKEYPNGLHVKEAKCKIDEFIAIEKDHKAFADASKINTKVSFESYLKSYSTGLHAIDAKKKIEEFILNDHSAYDKAVNFNTKQAYEIYLKEYSNGLHAKESKNKIEEFIAIEKDEQAFADALKINTKVSFESYLKSYPTGIHAIEAKNKIEEFIAIEKDHEAFHKAQKTNTKEAYKAYLNQYPNGLHVKEAKSKIEEIQKAEQLIADDQKALEIAKQLNTKESYKTYLNKYPNGRFAKEVQSKIDAIIKAEKVLVDNEAFKVAQKKDTKEAYKAYVSQYPNGLHVKEAKSKIEEIQKAEQLIADDHKAFETAKQKNTKDAYESYLKFYNNGHHKEEALTKIGEFDQEEQKIIEIFRLEALKKQNEEETWQKVKKVNTIKSYEFYLEQYPNGLYIKEAKNKIDEFIAIEKDHEAYVQAKQTSTKVSYETYLKNYSNGLHVKEAKNKISECNKILANKYKFAILKYKRFYDEEDFLGTMALISFILVGLQVSQMEFNNIVSLLLIIFFSVVFSAGLFLGIRDSILKYLGKIDDDSLKFLDINSLKTTQKEVTHEIYNIYEKFDLYNEITFIYDKKKEDFYFLKQKYNGIFKLIDIEQLWAKEEAIQKLISSKLSKKFLYIVDFCFALLAIILAVLLNQNILFNHNTLPINIQSQTINTTTIPKELCESNKGIYDNVSAQCKVELWSHAYTICKTLNGRLLMSEDLEKVEQFCKKQDNTHQCIATMLAPFNHTYDLERDSILAIFLNIEITADGAKAKKDTYIFNILNNKVERLRSIENEKYFVKCIDSPEKRYIKIF